MKWIPDYNYLLASKSPRRQELLKKLGINFKVLLKEVEEKYPNSIAKNKIPEYLSKLKAKPFLKELNENDLLITADTIVLLNEEVLGKPKSYQDAVVMLKKLSNNQHQVISGVTLTSLKKQKTFSSITYVRFKELTDKEIDYYVSFFNPMDKAGSYGIQEWIGYIGISYIEGSFYNVMGLPVQQLYEEILMF